MSRSYRTVASAVFAVLALAATSYAAPAKAQGAFGRRHVPEDRWSEHHRTNREGPGNGDAGLDVTDPARRHNR